MNHEKLELTGQTIPPDQDDTRDNERIAVKMVTKNDYPNRVFVTSQKVREHAVAHRGAFIRSYVNFGRIQGTRLKFKKLGLCPQTF